MHEEWCIREMEIINACRTIPSKNDGCNEPTDTNSDPSWETTVECAPRLLGWGANEKSTQRLVHAWAVLPIGAPLEPIGQSHTFRTESIVVAHIVHRSCKIWSFVSPGLIYLYANTAFHANGSDRYEVFVFAETNRPKGCLRQFLQAHKDVV